MKAFVLHSPGNVGYMDKAFPVLEEEHGAILTPVLVSPCTSDVHTVWQGSSKKPDLTLGHECVARVKAVGRGVRDFRPGELVAVPAITPDWSHPDVSVNYAHAGRNFSAHMLGKSIDGAFQEEFYIPWADRNLARIPEGLSPEDALMCTDVMATGYTAALEGQVSPGQTVVVMGIGAIGLAAIMACDMLGASKVFAIGSRPENVRLAESLGGPSMDVEVLNYKTLSCELPEGMHPLANSTGSSVVNYVLSRTGCHGADAVLICGGDDYAFPQAVDMVKYGTGIVSNVMYYGAAEHVNGLMDAILIPKFSIGRGMAGKTLKFSLSRGGRDYLEKLMGELAETGRHPGVFITKRYDGLEMAEQALYDMKNRAAVKVAVHISE